MSHTADNDNQGDDSSMLSEIFEIPHTIRLASKSTNATTGTVTFAELESVAHRLQSIDRMVIVACGTSFYAGLIGEYLLEELAGIPVEVQIASEFAYREEPFDPNTVVLAISQSGETADTIAALKKAEAMGALRLSIVNTTDSTIACMTDASLHCHAGIEQAVASTKAFIAQILILLQMSLHVAKKRHPLFRPLLNEIEALPGKAEIVLKQASHIEKIAQEYQDYPDFLFIGRRYGYPCALEGALKLKEVSYIHAEGYATGEIKHGPWAMIDAEFPTFALATDSPLLEKTYPVLKEIRLQDGKIIAIATEGNTSITKLADNIIYIPETLEQTQPILQAIVMQLFAYYVAIGKGLNVDHPRNLAKSVTVE